MICPKRANSTHDGGRFPCLVQVARCFSIPFYPFRIAAWADELACTLLGALEQSISGGVFSVIAGRSRHKYLLAVVLEGKLALRAYNSRGQWYSAMCTVAFPCGMSKTAPVCIDTVDSLQ